MAAARPQAGHDLGVPLGIRGGFGNGNAEATLGRRLDLGPHDRRLVHVAGHDPDGSLLARPQRQRGGHGLDEEGGRLEGAHLEPRFGSGPIHLGPDPRGPGPSVHQPEAGGRDAVPGRAHALLDVAAAQDHLAVGHRAAPRRVVQHDADVDGVVRAVERAIGHDAQAQPRPDLDRELVRTHVQHGRSGRRVGRDGEGRVEAAARPARGVQPGEHAVALDEAQRLPPTDDGGSRAIVREYHVRGVRRARFHTLRGPDVALRGADQIGDRVGAVQLDLTVLPAEHAAVSIGVQAVVRRVHANDAVRLDRRLADHLVLERAQ